jgi:hypothetical protein
MRRCIYLTNVHWGEVDCGDGEGAQVGEQQGGATAEASQVKSKEVEIRGAGTSGDDARAMGEGKPETRRKKLETRKQKLEGRR